MIIIDQDKNKIINFDNVNEISITETGEVLVVNNTYITNDCLDVLGKYETEERAKEVLQEIIDKYKEYATIQNRVGSISDVEILPKVYEMPIK